MAASAALRLDRPALASMASFVLGKTGHWNAHLLPHSNPVVQSQYVYCCNARARTVFNALKVYGGTAVNWPDGY
jgi:hypothetical protein